MLTNTVLKVYVPTRLFVAHHVKQFAKRTEGASGIEYAIIAAMVAIALAAFVTPISDAITSMFETLETAVTKKA